MLSAVSAVSAQEIRIETDVVDSFALNPAGDQLLTWTGDGALHTWDTASGTMLLEIQNDGGILGAQWSPDGTNILTWSSQTVGAWSAANGQSVLSVTPRGDIQGAQWAANGTLILFWTPDGVYQINAETAEVASRFEAAGEVVDMTASADAASIAVSLASDSVAVTFEALTTVSAPVDSASESSDAPLRAAVLTPGKWQVTWSNSRTSCPGEISSGSDRSFILLVDRDADEIRVEDVVIWSLHNFRYQRQANESYAFRRNETFNNGSIGTYEYSISIVSPTRIEGNNEVYVSGWNCADSVDMTWTLVDPSVICLAGAANGANLRSGPGTNYRNVGAMPPMETGDSYSVFDVVGQAIGTDNLRWWKLADDTWIREDVVSEEGDCENVPVVPAEETT